MWHNRHLTCEGNYNPLKTIFHYPFHLQNHLISLSHLIKFGYSHTFDFCIMAHQFWLCTRCDKKIHYQKFHQFFTWRWSIHEGRKVCLDPTWAGSYRSIMSPIGEMFSFWATWITCLMNWGKCSTSNTGRFRMMNMFRCS